MPPEEHPLQMRMAFTTPTASLAIQISLSGLWVLAGALGPGVARPDYVYSYLTGVGIQAESDPIRGVSFPVRDLPLLSELPNHVTVVPDDLLRPLFLLAIHPSDGGLPATLQHGIGESLRLSWLSGGHLYDEYVGVQLAAALLHSGASFVATPDAWVVLRDRSRLPVSVGQVCHNLDGYLAITTSVPQLLELSPLPGLFRNDDTHYGVALPYLPSVSSLDGLTWSGAYPTIEQGPRELPALPFTCSGHLAGDLRELVDRLAAYHAQALVWERGLGRRILALAALEVLDAWPLLVVTPPSGVWVWQRHLDLLGRTGSLQPGRGDATIITYRDLAGGAPISAPQSIIFDDPDHTEARGFRKALHRLDGILDAYRIACAPEWPERLEDAIACMAALRPGEFRDDIPLARRYPIQVQERAQEHLRAYRMQRRASDYDTDPQVAAGAFPASSVISLVAPDGLLRAHNAALRNERSAAPEEVLAELLEIVTVGPSDALSPKIAVAAARMRNARLAGERVAVITRHRRCALLLKATVRPLPLEVCDASEGEVSAEAECVVVRYDRELPNLRGFAEVIVMDYPWSTAVLEQAVGGAGEERGSWRVVILHLTGTVDDRLAMLAAHRRELATVSGGLASPTAAEIDYLLTPR